MKNADFRFILLITLFNFTILISDKEPMHSINCKFQLFSKTFQHTKNIPKKYTPSGEDYSPPLHWENAPKETKSFALIVDDPDAPHGTWTHWLVKNIPNNLTEIEENNNPGVEVTNSWKIKNWKGPQPPTGTHRYFFKLYALNTDQLKANTLKQFYEEVETHKIDEAILMGKYSS